MVNGMYGQDGTPSIPTGMTPYAPPMAGMGAGGSSLFQIGWRGKWLILLTTVLGVAGAYGYLRTLSPTYRGTAQVLVERTGQREMPGVPREVGTTVTNFLQTQAVLITSPAVVGMAMTDAEVLALPARPEEGYTRELIGTLSAMVSRNSDVIQVSASSPYPGDAAVVVNAVVRAYGRWHEANRELSAADMLRNLNDQLEQVNRELDRERVNKRMEEERNPELLEGARGGLASQTLDLLKRELATARVTVMERRAFYDGLVRHESDPNKFRRYVQSSQSTTAGTGMDAERGRVEQELYGIRLQLQEIEGQSVTIRHSQIELLRNRKKQLEDRLAEMDAEFVESRIALAQIALEEAIAREQRLGGQYQEAMKTLGASGGSPRYTMIVERCAMLESIANTLLQKIRELDLNLRTEGLKIHVLRPASADAPDDPQTARILGIGLVLGLMSGGGLAFLRDMRDQRVRSADEIVGILGVPILGAVPTFPRRGILRRRRTVQFDGGTHESEAYRSIRTSLFFGAQHDDGKILLVTSPGALEGKTTLVSNLGIAMAHAGQKTLIIDADLRKPKKHRIFASTEQQSGLVDVLTETATLEEAIRPTDTPDLDVLESGPVVPNPSELLSSDMLGAVLEQLKGRYDRILVDSPPVGLVADAQILATRCGLTLLVLRAEKSSRIVTERARDALSTVRATIVGAVVNDVHKKDTRYSHYGSGAYSYYHNAIGPNGRKAARKELPPSASSQLTDGALISEGKAGEKTILQQLFSAQRREG